MTREAELANQLREAAQPLARRATASNDSAVLEAAHLMFDAAEALLAANDALETAFETCAKIAEDMVVTLNRTTQTDPALAFKAGTRAQSHAIAAAIRAARKYHEAEYPNPDLVEECQKILAARKSTGGE